MATSALTLVKENARRALTGDHLYEQKGRYLFVIRGPVDKGPLGPLGVAQFPLVLNPESFEYDLPFAAEITPLQEGGIISEENGIVIGEISIAGTTGFCVKGNPGEYSYTRGDGQFTGGVDTGDLAFSEGATEVSGHMHFWRLATRCFDGYSALKKDPQTASATTMEFHATKEDLHVRVIPRSFALNRSSGSERVSYRYNIRLAVVGPASIFPFEIKSPDASLLESLKDAISTVRSAIKSVQATVNDINAAMDEIRRTITGMAGIIRDLGDVLDACTDFINGVTSFIDIPLAFVQATASVVEAGSDLVDTIDGLPSSLKQKMRELVDAVDAISFGGKNHFREPYEVHQFNYETRTLGFRSGVDTVKDSLATEAASKASRSNGKLSIDSVFGSNMLPGDLLRGNNSSLKGKNRFFDQYKGFEERTVTQGDTLQSLSAKYLGDARLWLALAIANQLKAPYITGGPKLPNTLQPGSKIIIPVKTTLSNPDTFSPGESVLGNSQSDKLLGADLELQKTASGRYDVMIDSTHGSDNLNQISGVKNLGQAIACRLRTEQRHNVLYPSLGLPRVIGVPGFDEDLTSISNFARQQLLADPRVKSLTSFKFVFEGDTVSIEASVIPVGSTSDRVISRVLT